MTMVEKVARVLFTRKVEEFVCDGTWEENAALHEDFMQDARAAIEAMREPTNDMLQAMYEAMFEDKFTGGELPMLNAGFEAAIDAALNEEVSE